jgi:hypothetical protein
VALEADAHQVPGLALVPVRGRPDGDDARYRLPLVDPDLDAQAASAPPQGEQVVRDREALGLRQRKLLQPLGAGRVQVAAAARADVAGDAGRVPAEVVGGGDVGEEGVPLLVPEVLAGLAQARGLDDEGRLSVGLLRLEQPWDAQEATPRSS